MSSQSTSSEIRQQFIDFFVERCGHTAVDSSPVVPVDDPSLLFTNAGMNQFKDVFLGVGSREYTRAVDTQKCIRAGGKHNDLDDVGKDTYHHTFFEMLGNWSFGDYFKAEAIQWAWELLTETWGLAPERLYATYFEGSEADGLEPDHEARELWLRHLPPERVLPGNMKDNFWEMGESGPCGPCSELHYDRTDDLSGGPLVNADDHRVIEIWNLVFIQFNRGASGELTALPAKHVDTGMGFERIVAVLQGKASNYDTDVFSPLFESIRQLTGARAYGGELGDPVDVAYRVIADHARCLTFALTDGAVPSNEGRGYVLRRILRRGVRYGRQTLGVTEPFIHKLVPTIVETMGEAFPELQRAPDQVARIIEDEEEAFVRTLDRGIELFEQAAKRAKEDVVSGEDAFHLYDTHGFPLDLTQLMAEERGMTVDVERFEALMEQQRKQSRGEGEAVDARQSLLEYVQQNDLPETQFVGYEELVIDGSKIKASLLLSDDRVYYPTPNIPEAQQAAIVVDRTPFYAEAGGQVGDTGYIRSHEGAVFRVEDTIKFGGVYFHLGRLESGSMHRGDVAFDEDDTLMLEVDAKRRARVRANHTSTHMLNRALRDLVNPEADQRGSLVDDEKLRFDFSNAGAVGVNQINEVEDQVNRDIAADLPVDAAVAPQEQAREINGLRAVFGEKYPPKVRVVSIGPKVEDLLDDPDREEWSRYSIEFCGGTHLSRTAEAERFAVVGEEAVAKGVRRITAVTGQAAVDATKAGSMLLESVESLTERGGEALEKGLAEVGEELASQVVPLTMRAKLRDRIEGLQKKLKAERKAASKEAAAAAIDQAKRIAAESEGPIIVASLDEADGSTLRQAMDVIRRSKPESALLLGARDGEKAAFLASVPAGMIERGLKAGDWVREVAKVAGGGGGGKPDMAQAGGKNPEKLDAALETGRGFAEETLQAASD